MKRILASMTVKRSAILLVALCLLISITTVLVGGYISERTKRLEVEWIDSERDITKRIDVLSKLHNAMGFGGVIHQFKNYVLRHDEYRVEAFNTQVDSALSVIQSYRDLGIESIESAALEQIESTVRAYASKIAIAKRLIAEGQTAEQIDAVIKINDAPALQALQSLETHITSTHDNGIEEFSGRLAEISILVFSASIGFPLLLLVLAGMLGYGVWLLLKHLGGEPSDVVMISWKVANGELELPECQMKKDSSSAMGALVAMVCKLVDVIAEIRSGADSVDESARTINEQNRELNQRTINQAANLEKTSASMEEMTATVKQNAESAFQANQLTLDARKGAEHGGEAVAEVVAAMTEIHASSQKIGDITTVIDEIAFQTNLLALNAAVEAARAGDQGRGFAVVASEVRNLAQRSAEAAKEIKVLIDDSVSKAESGAHLVNEAGDTLTELIESVQKVSSLMAEMATANEEQSQGIEQVNQAIIQMENETQQNAELVEKASEASSSMTQQAHALRNGVDFFKLRQDLDAFEKLPAVEPLPLRRQMALDKTPVVEAPPQLETLAWNGGERRSTVRPWTDNIQQPKSKPVPKSKVKADQGNSWESF